MRNFTSATSLIAITIASLVVLHDLSGGSVTVRHIDTEQSRRCRIMFYNVENLFDYLDDGLTGDDEFTPAGVRHWTKSRYEKKLNNLYKVIIAAGGWQPPDIVGICEIENRRVLEDLFYGTPLSKFNYSIVHHDSHDPRGIDVALAYRGETITYIKSSFINLKSDSLFTRDILYFKCMAGKDILHVFINHWPSRSSGQLETEPARIIAAKALRRMTDSIFSADIYSNVILTGDFNDTPSDESISRHLGAAALNSNIYPAGLYNTASGNASGGTIKYQGTWFVFDQFILSGSFFSNANRIKALKSGYTILDESYLLTEDETHNGKRPFRTYSGYSYEGGFSDHLPVYIDLY